MFISDRALRNGIIPPWWYRRVGYDRSIGAVEYAPLFGAYPIRVYRRVLWGIMSLWDTVRRRLMDADTAYRSGYWAGRSDMDWGKQ